LRFVEGAPHPRARNAAPSGCVGPSHPELRQIELDLGRACFLFQRGPFFKISGAEPCGEGMAVGAFVRQQDEELQVAAEVVERDDGETAFLA